MTDPNRRLPLSDFYFLERKGPSRPSLEDVRGSVQAGLAGLGLAPENLHARRIAIAVGSRGIASLQEIVRAVCSWLKEQSAQPFIVPAMGSHGGGTAEGQREVLAGYGITEAGVGAEVLSSPETREVGTTPQGFRVFADRLAWESDGIVVVNRVKPHSDLVGGIESGMLKMLAIGLGKREGATEGHKQFVKCGFETTIRAAFAQILASGKVLCGVAIVENEMHAVAEVRAARPENMVAVEESAIALARALMPRLPFRRLDLLIEDEMGKNISGAGMDTKVVGRARGQAPAAGPVISVIYARNLTEESGGNAIGVGNADIIHERFFRKIDLQKTYVNALTALNPVGGRLPMHLPSDFAALEFVLAQLGSPEPAAQRCVWIRNTLSLNRLAISPLLREEIDSPQHWRLVENPFSAQFDNAGDLRSPFEHRAS
jgi:energy-converting hydrogenase Eha subunit G